MRIILLKDFENLGKSGEQVDVKDGYARNYLFPQNIALKANKTNLKRFEEQKQLLETRKNKTLKKSNELAEKLKSLSLTIPVKVGEEDKVFGSVTAQNIADQLVEKGYEIDKRQILLEEPIKALGIFDIPVKLHPKIETTVKLWVIKS
ncbi:MAG: 50S ribosomal protein L9 [Ignavibacteriae bacterium]|nr:MAG: 50S ribosomal protein L9 [Ignavibacteriota bacterium]